jgi:cytoskeleton protein RodZ
MNAGGQNEREATQIGALLEKKRREKGLSLKDVEQATKIRTRYLEGLEREDYSVLPDAVYVQGFLKTYANFLGLDGERLSRELRERRAPRRERQPIGHNGGGPKAVGEPELPPITLGGVERRRVSGVTVLTVTLAVLVLAAVIGVLYFIGRGSQSAGEPPVKSGSKPSQEEGERQPEKEPVADQETTTPATRVDGGAANEPAPETLRATVKVVDNPSWLNIQTDQTVPYSQVAQPGFDQTFEARDAMTISAGNAGAVEVEVNGRNFGRLGSYGEVLSRTFIRDTAG